MANSSFQRIVRLEGISECLQGIPRELKADILATAVGEAAKPIVKSAKRHAAKSRLTGALQRSISSLVRKYKQNAVAVAVIGPDRRYYSAGKRLGKKADRRGADQPSRYAHLVEFGHTIAKGGTLRDVFEIKFARVITKTGKSVWRRVTTDRIKRYATGKSGGVVPAKPFLRPAVAENKGVSEAVILAGIKKGIERVRSRLVKKGVHRS